MSERNARFFMLEKHKQMERVDPERHSKRIMEQMKKDSRLKDEPHRIDCFDNSNIQGAYPVAAMVVFTEGKPNNRNTGTLTSKLLKDRTISLPWRR